ncbi:MAG: hypothetical protein GY913_30280 [Proteobacteria bacterium]|nr:hypothetical protein [Pseudomonadota bacterium]MCP4921206.1 hypothetical protein [Pseudomonadota bacterium]
MAHDPGVLYLLSSAILSSAWFGLVGVVWLVVSWQLRQMRASHGELPAASGWGARFDYLLAFMLLPAAFVLGVSNLRKPETALFGRNCLAIGIANITLILVVTCAGMTMTGFFRPELLV